VLLSVQCEQVPRLAAQGGGEGGNSVWAGSIIPCASFDYSGGGGLAMVTYVSHRRMQPYTTGTKVFIYYIMYVIYIIPSS
jgi:hypothetical protein